MKILVLGGCGFIGAHVVKALTLAGDDVRVFGHAGDSRHIPLDGVDYRTCDFTDTRQLDAALEGMDVVVHAISTSTPGSASDHSIEDIRGNLISTIQLLDLMRRHGMRRILFLSSGGTVYGNPEQCPVTEDAPLRPISSYGVIKVAIEKYLFMYRQLYDFQPLVLRPSNPYGPGQGDKLGAITRFMHLLLHDKPITVWGDGRIVRDYLSVAALAKLCAMAARSRVCGIFNAGSCVGYSLNEVIAMIAGVSGRKPEVQYQAPRVFDVQSIVLNCNRAEREFGWSAHGDLQHGICEYWQWMLENET